MRDAIKRLDATALAAAALALAVRILFLSGFAATPLFLHVEGGHDRSIYHQAAQLVAAGQVWPDGSFAFLPLYPWVLGLLYFIAGPSLLAAAGLGLLCDTVTTFLLVRLARRLGASAPWAGLGGLLYACYPRAVVYATLTMPTALNILLVTALALGLAPTGPRSTRRWAALGLLAGLAGLGYPAVWPALLIIMVVTLIGRGGAGPARRQALVLLAAALLPVLPVVIHNTRAEGRLTLLTTHGGINVYMGNHEQATGYPLRIRDFRLTATAMLEDAHRAAEAEVGHALTRAESSAWWSGQARAYMRAQPAAYLRLLARKARLFWSGTEVDGLRMVEQVRLMSPRLVVPGWTCFALFSAAGLFGLLRAGPAPAVRLLTWTMVAGVVSLFITTRYRLPLIPLLAAFGAAGLTVLAHDLRQRQRLAGHGLALLAALGLAAWPGGVRDLRSTDHYNASVQWLAAGRITEALAEARSGLALAPNSAELHHAEGSALFRLDQHHEAAQAFARALAQRPTYATARYNLALSLARDGQPCAALSVLKEDPAPEPRMVTLAETLRQLCPP